MFSKEEENLFSQQSSNDDKYEVSKFVRNLCFFNFMFLFVIHHFLFLKLFIHITKL